VRVFFIIIIIYYFLVYYCSGPVRVFVTSFPAVPFIKLLASGEGDRKGHVVPYPVDMS
jgi:hypothetical protein